VGRRLLIRFGFCLSQFRRTARDEDEAGVSPARVGDDLSLKHDQGHGFQVGRAQASRRGYLRC
jgi:hypothetical protein